jgi:DNA excision repair protein ERCC-4
MVVKMKVTIDTRETDRIRPAMFYFSINNNVSVQELETGDFLFEDGEKQAVFEYKTMADFINSVTEGRVFNQAIDQQREFMNHFVIVEGTDEDRKTVTDDLYYSTGLTFTKKQFYGAITRLNTFTTVIRVPNRKTAFEVMEQQAKKCFDEKAIAKVFPKSEGNSAFRFLCYCCQGVGPVTAEKIVEELKLKNLEDVMNLTKTDLMKINRIGDATASSILEQVRLDCS